jgi:hypothetical protein
MTWRAVLAVRFRQTATGGIIHFNSRDGGNLYCCSNNTVYVDGFGESLSMMQSIKTDTR